MFRWAQRMAFCSSVLMAGAALAASPHFRVEGDAIALVQDAERFSAFARDVASSVDASLQRTSEPAGEKLLLGLRLHLALHFREDELALRLAERIRASQTDPGERAHSGLTTRAIVMSQRDPARFEREFSRLLLALPKAPATRLALLRARQKIEEMSRDSLLSDVREQVAPGLARGEAATLQMADQLVRAGHRLRTILPLREAMLRAYARAIAAQT